ncbi:MAG: DEAD/DEAH box helicase [Natronohydrobacter sp.]|nr:DEAD/DEAH box helicase [Natronohydrobacter sp.]
MIATLKEALTERGFDTMTDVQEAVTAPELADADLLVSAQTGSGKTVGFGLAIAGTLLGDDERFGPPALPLALVIAPTRELALQVQRELAWLYAKTGAKVVSCIGGMDARDERRALDRGAHIVVGTPGRLRDHIMRGAFDMSDLRAVVLDEADEMLDLGFREDLEYMLGEAPEGKRTLLFSATVPPAIVEIAKTYQRDAVRVTTISRGVQHSDISYQVVKVAASDAEHAIINLLRFHDAPASIVFANTRATVARLAARFANRGLSVVSLSGELSQDERSHALQSLRDGRARVCVATDVAARGIDLPNLDLVIHADLPMNTEALLHRSGRTGRAGRKGVSVLIAPDRAAGKAERLLKWAKINAEWVNPPTAEEILALDEQRLRTAPVWEGELTEDEIRFAAELLAERAPEEIAAACLRLYRAGLSAPEDIDLTPNPKAARPERAEFGPSVWFELSVGQDKRAEARWLLPMLCRAGNLDKSSIGRIKVQTSTTAVEIAATAAPALLARLGAGGVLEEDITARQLDSAPDDTRTPRSAPRPERPARPRDDRPARPRDDAAPKPRWSDAPEGPRKSAPRSNDAAPKPRWSDSADAARKPAPRAPYKPRPSDAPEGPSRAPHRAFAEDRTPRPARVQSDATTDAPRKPRHVKSDRPDAGKSYGAPRPQGGKPGYGGDRPKGPRTGGPKGPRSNDATPRMSDEAPARTEGSKLRAGAANVSQRMERPGSAKPKTGGKPFAGKPGGAKPGAGKFGGPKPSGLKPRGPKPGGGSTPPRRKP